MAVQIPFPLPATGFALNSKVRVNLDFLVAQFNEFNSGTATWDNVSVGTANSLTGTVTFYNAFNANYLSVQAGATSSSHTYTLPLALPGSTGVLQSDSAGTLSWATTISGQFLFSAGTAATPSIRAVDNIDTGLYYTVANTVLALSHEGTRFFGKEGGGVFLEGIPNGASGGLVYNASGYLQCLANSLGATGIVAVSSAQTPKVVSLLGTTNQVAIATNANDFTFSLPQSIDTAANVQFGSVRTGAGSSASTALKLNAANTGLYMNAANIIAFTIQGTDYASLDDTGAFFTTGEHRGSFMRALATSNQLVLGVTRTVTLTAPTPATTSRTVSFPDLSADYSVVGTEGIQTINGAKTLTAVTTFSNPSSTAVFSVASNSAGIQGVFIDNTSNTASSRARLAVRVAGSSAGNAWALFQVAGAQAWSMGVDNSASDAFRISGDVALGSNDAFGISTGLDIGIVSAKKFYLDGVAASGDTYLVESASNTLDLVAGGVTNLSATATLHVIGVIPKFAGTNTTGAGSALLGANSPASTNTAPYTWIQAQSSDGSTVYIPCWK